MHCVGKDFSLAFSIIWPNVLIWGVRSCKTIEQISYKHKVRPGAEHLLYGYSFISTWGSHRPTDEWNLQQDVTDPGYSLLFREDQETWKRLKALAPLWRLGLGTVDIQSVWGKGHILVSMCKLGGIEMSCVKQESDLCVLAYVSGQITFKSLLYNSRFSLPH